MFGRDRKRSPQPSAADDQPVTLQLIAEKLAKLVWRRRLWGVDEKQVWHVVQRMDEMYRQIYHDQEVRYQALLDQARSGVPEGSMPLRRPTVQVPDVGMAAEPPAQAGRTVRFQAPSRGANRTFATRRK